MERPLRILIQRSGTSRGLFVTREHLAKCAGVIGRGELSAVEEDTVAKALGSRLNGVGGESAVTCKACVVEPADSAMSCKYWFFQGIVGQPKLDTSHGDCGNMIAGVGPFAVANGLVGPCSPPEATVRVTSQTTGAVFDITLPINNQGLPEYEGAYSIDGVQGAGSMIIVHTLSPVGSTTGSLWPTGSSVDQFDAGSFGIVEASCVDACRCLVILKAESFGLHGSETVEQVTANQALLDAVESIRLKAAEKMLLGDCTGKVSPKVCLVSHDEHHGGAFRCIYFIAPFRADVHPTLAMTAAQALAIAALEGNTVLDAFLNLEAIVHQNVLKTDSDSEGMVRSIVPISHPLGKVEISVDRVGKAVERSGYIRTVRPIVDGTTFPFL